MNSEDNENEEVNKKNNCSRVRVQGECSESSDDGGSTSAGKRQRTISKQFLVASGVTGASPPKFVSLEEIMKAANGMRDMALIHQIAIDKNFKLERVEPSNSVQKAVKDTMHKAFWDILREQLAEDPRNYTQAFALLENIKEGLFVILLPQHTKIKQQISEILDSDLIRQQAENDALDFQHYAQYVISVMAKLCAPVRDEKIKELTETTDVIETFKGILETLDLMALDMANFTIEIVRPDIVAHSVELERKRFADYLSIQQDGLKNTRKWLIKHLDYSKIPLLEEKEKPGMISRITTKVFSKACLDFLDWNEEIDFPETFMLDEKRLFSLKISVNRIITLGTILLVTGSYVGPDLQTLTSFKKTIKEHSSILLQSVNSEKDLVAVLENVAVQILEDIKEAQKTHSLNELSKEAQKLLSDQITDIAKSDHRVRQLVQQRIQDFLVQIIESATAVPQKMPSGLSALQNELATIAGEFLRIVSHNVIVFDFYYTRIIEEEIKAYEMRLFTHSTDTV